MDFSDAMKELKNGHMIKRKSWPRGSFVVIALKVRTSVLKSLSSDPSRLGDLQDSDEPRALYQSSGVIQVWAPSTKDMLAEDWDVIELD